MSRTRFFSCGVAVLALAALLSGCAGLQHQPERTTKRDKTGKGAAIGAAGGALLGAILGEGELDEVLAGAVIGAGVGAGVGAYMDRQEERLARIPGTTVERVSDDMLLVHFDSDVLFSLDSAILHDGSQTAIERAAAVFMEHPKTAIIAQGHTDSTGSEVYNEQLSRRRATSVMHHLVYRGVDVSRITAVGYGEAHPAATNSTPEGRSYNRRVDLLLKAKAR
jgi:outer membrane protein OmpA-like peptidoglycan-associated protein